MRLGEWRAYNQPLATIQAPKLPIAIWREAAMNRRRFSPLVASARHGRADDHLGPKINQSYRIIAFYVPFWDRCSDLD
jgi:hypothetical protein